MTRHTMNLGKIDYNGKGRRNCKVTIEWEFVEGRFSMTGTVWNPRETDAYSCGQNLDDIAKYFKHNKRVKRMVEIWKRWHLNDMRAGSPAQMEFLRSNPVTYAYPESHYEKAGAALAAVGLNPDPNYLHKGKPYLYGHAWIKEDLPVDVVAEIESWSKAEDQAAA